MSLILSICFVLIFIGGIDEILSNPVDCGIIDSSYTTKTNLYIHDFNPEKLKSIGNFEETGEPQNLKVQAMRTVSVKSWMAATNPVLFFVASSDSCFYNISASIQKEANSTVKRVIVTATPEPDCDSSLGQSERKIRAEIQKCLLRFASPLKPVVCKTKA